MNTGLSDGYLLLEDILQKISEKDLEACDVSIFAPFTHLKVFQSTLNGTGMKIGAQNCHHEKSGAFTGEVSAEMLASVPVHQVLIGHSERRQYFNETNAQLAEKINRAMENGIDPIYCFGETLEQREDGSFKAVVEQQILEGISHLSEEALSRVVLAYEPVWAIGTGKTASAEQAQEIHAMARNIIKEKYSDTAAQHIRILYGGSVKPSNAAELFSMPDIDGGLIGGASLDAESFEGIVKA